MRVLLVPARARAASAVGAAAWLRGGRAAAADAGGPVGRCGIRRRQAQGFSKPGNVAVTTKRRRAARPASSPRTQLQAQMPMPPPPSCEWAAIRPARGARRSLPRIIGERQLLCDTESH
jgi:hypothetical protein